MHDQPLAYHRPEFLESDEARPIRILAEYLEPLRRFKAQNIQDTVVFFGSARVHSRMRRRARAAAAAQRRNTRHRDYAAALKRSRKAVEWSRYYEDARELAQQLTSGACRSSRRATASSSARAAGPGIMEAANRGAHEAGGKRSA